MRTMRRFVVGSVGLVLVVGGVALASIPDQNGVIHACYRNSNGQLRVIDNATQTCSSGETALTWNQTGPAGLQGPVGPTGPEGLPGSEIVARLRLSGAPVEVTSVPFALPFSPASWTQQAAQLNMLYARVSVSNPTNPVDAQFSLFVDGVRLTSARPRIGGTGASAGTLEFEYVVTDDAGIFVPFVLFEPDQNETHQIAVTVHGTTPTIVHEFSVDVVAVG